MDPNHSERIVERVAEDLLKAFGLTYHERAAAQALIRDAVVSERERLRPRWLFITPVVPGFYWWRERPGKVPSVVELVASEMPNDPDPRLICVDWDQRIPRGPSDQWAGPLDEP